MPVIGRLDKQVSDVLIDPVGGRRRGEDDAERATSDARTGAAYEDAPPAARDADGERSRPRAGHGEDRGRTDEQLPVWLL